MKVMAKSQLGEMDKIVFENCAMTCRVATSFMRIGHIDLHARRARRSDATDQQKQDYENIVQHALDREYPTILPNASLAERAVAMWHASAENIAHLMAEWIRVGFTQGNFNRYNHRTSKSFHLPKSFCHLPKSLLK